MTATAFKGGQSRDPRDVKADGLAILWCVLLGGAAIALAWVCR